MKSYASRVLRTLRLPSVSQLALVASCLALHAAPLRAQDGANDPGFNPLDTGLFGVGPNADTWRVVLQPDGKALITGAFTEYNGIPRAGIARVNSNGSLDLGFDPGGGASGQISTLALAPNGRVLVAGSFANFGASGASGLVRLLPNGAVDPSFSAALPFGTALSSVELQPDGRVLVAGSFPGPAGAPKSVRRLFADGALDPSFAVVGAATPALSAFPNCLELQPDGKLLVGGLFTTLGGVTRPNLIRLNADGSVDTSFAAAGGPNGGVNNIHLQPDGRVLITGSFTTFAGVASRRVARLHPDGSLDLSFDVGTGPQSQVLGSTLQADGKLLVGGGFSSINGVVAMRFGRLNSDGSVDTSFATTQSMVGSVYALAQQPDGQVLVGGWFSTSQSNTLRNLIRVSATASFDAAYNVGGGADSDVRTVVLRPDGRALVGGLFGSFNAAASPGLVQVDAAGKFDPSFAVGAGVDGLVTAMALQPDGKLLLAGLLSSYAGSALESVVRVMPDGSRDSSFDVGSGALLGFGPGSPRALAVQPDGRILIAGQFDTFAGATRGCIVRLNSDGTVDSSFTTPGLGAEWPGILAVVVQPDGKLLIAGRFTNYAGVIRRRIARLHPDGSLDLTFNAAVVWSDGADNDINALQLQPDGRIVIGGSFSSYSGVSRNGVARLFSDGSLDASFDPGAGVTFSAAAGRVETLVLQPDGKVLLGGRFDTVDTLLRKNLARLNANGSADASFDPGPGTNLPVYALALEPSGRLWVGGQFTNCRGVPRGRLARLVAFVPAPAAYCTAGTSTNGCVPAMSSSGTPSASASAGFSLVASGLEGQRAGIFFYGVSGRADVPWGAGSTSRICVASPTQRMLVSNSSGVAGQCNGVRSEDWNAWMAAQPSALGQPRFVGEVVSAQCWYRDPPAPRGTNLTNALEFMLGL